MQGARKHELYLADPLLDGFSLRLRLLRVGLEVVGEVAVQVVAPGVLPDKGFQHFKLAIFVNILCYKGYNVNFIQKFWVVMGRGASLRIQRQ